MRLYQHDPEDSASLSNNAAEVIYVDRQGALWIGTWNGLNRYDPQADAFHAYQHDPNDSGSLASIIVVDLQEDSTGRLWIAVGEGGRRMPLRPSHRYLCAIWPR